MRSYEVMVIFDVGAEPPAIQAVVDRTLETIRSAEGVPGHVDRWGRRPFAYEVKHRREGYYVLIEFTGTSRTVADVDRLLSLADEALRHKVIRLPDKAVRRLAATGGDRPSQHSRASAPTRGPRPRPPVPTSPSPGVSGSSVATADASDEGGAAHSGTTANELDE